MPKKKLNKIDEQIKAETFTDSDFLDILNENKSVQNKIDEANKNKEAEELGVPLMETKAQNAKEYVKVLDYLNYKFKYNEISSDVLVSVGNKWMNYYEYDGVIKTEVSDLVSQYWRKELSNGLFENAVKSLYQLEENRFNPVVDRLKSLKWDEKPRMTDFFNKFTDKYNLTNTLFPNWMLGSIERVLNPMGFQNPVLILDGKQGVGKSSLVRYLAMPFEEYYDSGTIDPNNKDSRIALTSNFIFDWSEGAGLSKREIEGLKELLTKDKEKVRLPYGRKPIEKKIISNIIMTKNDTGAFLKDQTGNRRFNILKDFDIVYDYTKEGYDVSGDWYEFGLGKEFFEQLWAEVYEMWKADKEKKWVTSVRDERIRKAMEEVREECLSEPALYETLDSIIVERKGSVLSVMDLYKKIEDIDRHFDRNKHYNIVSDYFRHRYGIEKGRVRSSGNKKQFWAWQGVGF